ncbi:hypothetical protein FJR11_19620 [Anabaena sp. UHCC 0187]|uniref:hypothetical protein n=1 Tax=Anabaena sp. UHCC 0187 TaxID=2590018 RepID=UPI0014466C00|nr:hypothetical protein [Anabaena sp. UHCC 0187]MTJ14745.1 hypothetical protein [Anabaena sp. UHCC 0187]
MITLEQFNPQICQVEKTKFRLSDKVFNVSEGWTQDYDVLGSSHLWRYDRTIEQQRIILWQEIKAYLPRYQEGKLKVWGAEPNWYRGMYFKHLIHIVEFAKQHENVKLIYISDRSHAELIQRCVEWLLTQV